MSIVLNSALALAAHLFDSIQPAVNVTATLAYLHLIVSRLLTANFAHIDNISPK